MGGGGGGGRRGREVEEEGGITGEVRRSKEERQGGRNKAKEKVKEQKVEVDEVIMLQTCAVQQDPAPLPGVLGSRAPSGGVSRGSQSRPRSAPTRRSGARKSSH